MTDPSLLLLKAANDVGGWVFGTCAIFAGAVVVIRWQLGLIDRQAATLEKLTGALDRLTEEVRASMRRT